MFTNAEGQQTAVAFRAAMLCDGTPVPADRCCLPRTIPILLEEAVVEEADPDAEVLDMAEGADAGEEEIGMTTKMHRGWATSYRRTTPEARPCRSWCKRFTKHRMKWEQSNMKLVQARNPSHAKRLGARGIEAASSPL